MIKIDYGPNRTELNSKAHYARLVEDFGKNLLLKDWGKKILAQKLNLRSIWRQNLEHFLFLMIQKRIG